LDVIERVVERTAVPVVYVTHSSLEVARIADRALVLDSGSIVGSGDTAEVLCGIEASVYPGDEMLSRIEACHHAYDPADGIATFEFDGGQLRMPARTRPVRERQRFVVRASDVSVALAPVENTSILNCLPVVIEHLRPLPPSTVLVRCRAGTQPLLAAITSLSARELGLRPGLSCFVQLKATALGGHGDLEPDEGCPPASGYGTGAKSTRERFP